LKQWGFDKKSRARPSKLSGRIILRLSLAEYVDFEKKEWGFAGIK
jgi:hypothetical protein